jgi:hypothetical protein
VINHDHEEGFFRIADNSITPGLKIWTWGYPSSNMVDPFAGIDEARPYIELWAGVTREFWQRTTLDASTQLEIRETYAPSVGMVAVTHANQDFFVNLEEGTGRVDCQVFGFYPEQTVEILMTKDGDAFHKESVTLDPLTATDCSTQVPDSEPGIPIELIILDEEGKSLFHGNAIEQE